MDIGNAGRHSDGGVLSNSDFGQALEDGSFSIPSPCPLPSTTEPNLPYVIVGDEAFPLRMNMLRPYPGKNLPGKYSYTFFVCYNISYSTVIFCRRSSHFQLQIEQSSSHHRKQFWNLSSQVASIQKANYR